MQQSGGAAPRGVQQLNSLLIEPDMDTRIMLELALSIRGQDVTACESAKAARAALSNTSFPLIILNRTLPDADALHFCGEVRTLPGGAQSSILMIALSPSEADRAAATEAGADDYIPWPVDADELRQRLDAAEQQAGKRVMSQDGSAAGNRDEILFVVNADGSIRRAGSIAELLLGFPPEALTGVNAFSFFHTDDSAHLLSVLVESLTRAGPTRAIEVRVRRDGDSWRTITVCAENQMAVPDIHGITFSLRGPDAKVQVADQVTRTTMHDRITDLPNRSLFIDRVDHAVTRATRRNQPVVVMVVDFNDFESPDGTQHPGVSEGLIVALAQRVRSCLRTSDTASRLGDDEFGLLLEEIIDLKNVSIVANRLVQAMGVPFYDGGEEIELRPNIGIAVSTSERFRAVDLVRDANIARAWARVQGSGQYVMFDPSMKAPEGEPVTDRFEIQEVAATPAPAVATSIDDRLVTLQERIASLEQVISRLDRLTSTAKE